MGGRLTFNVAEVRTLIEHAKRAPDRAASMADLFNPHYHKGGKVVIKNGWPDEGNLVRSQIPAGLWLVKDHGVYLMSNGMPALKVESDKPNNRVAYAAEAAPVQGNFDNWYDNAKRIMGGDDCVITLPLTMLEPVIAAKGDNAKIVLKVTAKNISVVS
ncbi:DUF3085 domain-containing protein [Acidithiobacillus ferridurans]|uniref:DUF3085 domain-containing protein n=1 Tax=Acidithiobacillus ferridurans TaxID=1232575 RepID=A0A8X8GEJ7_ACIFI|nr:DUF3085 domain-containing protein [Acidithiobacillus ferridurans]MBU2715123.1 DUF3085 domain-containing protein [Acidithiobacillus ferridurans]MBU2724902.1 DUF3085 domain-containing protein [Acidithiobacillus ferridurans]MBU2728161.1 DUF3085 domain-containing protein [Acidithiobacillus ferridurans]